MADGSTIKGSGIAAFASRHARATVVTAYLLTGEWLAANEAAAQALVIGSRVADHVDDAAAGHRAAAAALARRHVRARGPWRFRGGGLELQELGAHPSAAVDDPGALWPGLSQLTEHERAAVVLRCHEGLDPSGIAAALRRSPAAVERDLDIGYEIVEQAARDARTDSRDIEADLRAFFAAHRDLSPPTGLVEQRAALLDRRRRRTRYGSVAVAAAAALVAVAAGTVALQSGEPVASGGRQTTPGDPPPWAQHPRSPSLPVVGPNRKLVGFRSVMVAVPASWTQVTARCAGITENAVVYPAGRRAALCGDQDVPRGLSAVSFKKNIAGEPEVQGDFGPRRTHGGELIVLRPQHRGDRYVAYTSAPDLGFGMSITARSARTLHRIIDSITVVPAGYTTVPDLLGRPSEQAVRIVSALGLAVDQRFRPGFVPVPLDVARQSAAVGTVLPLEAPITLRLVPHRSPPPGRRRPVRSITP